jgi:hypothetical protein
MHPEMLPPLSGHTSYEFASVSGSRVVRLSSSASRRGFERIIAASDLLMMRRKLGRPWNVSGSTVRNAEQH